jgi:hypothetical protein
LFGRKTRIPNSSRNPSFEEEKAEERKFAQSEVLCLPRGGLNGCFKIEDFLETICIVLPEGEKKFEARRIRDAYLDSEQQGSA